MSGIRLKRNTVWNAKDEVSTLDQAMLQVMQDVRDELQRLNTLLHCSNFQRIPLKLDAIRKNTTKPKRKKVNRGKTS